MTVYKYVQQEQENKKDIFSRLHSNIIDHLNGFLTKPESIIFGYLNKQTYIESQKKSFLLARIKTDRLAISNFKHFCNNGVPFAYSLPTQLYLWYSLFHHGKRS